MTDNEKLAALIETWLLGVPADSQDLELEDHDWQLIIAALRTPQAGDELASLPVDSGMDRDTVAKAEWLWANLPVGPRKWTSLATHEKALVCHTLSRFTTLTPADTAQSDDPLGEGENFMQVRVSQDGRTIGIDHPTEASWEDVLRAHISLRDRLNERIAEQQNCPFAPDTAQSEAEQVKEAAARYIEGYGGVIPGAAVFAPMVSGNNQPCMSGDPRDRLHSHIRRQFDDATRALADAIRAMPLPTTDAIEQGRHHDD